MTTGLIYVEPDYTDLVVFTVTTFWFPAASVAVTVNVSVPEAVGVPLMVSVLLPLLGTLSPATWLVSLTVVVMAPVPLPAVIVWL